MLNNKKRIDDEKLDRFGNELMRAFEATEVEIHNAATSPFLFRRIRARIEAEQRRLAEESNPWLALFAQVRQAIPVFALLAVVALASSLYLHSSENKPQSEPQMTLVAGLPVFLQDSQEDVEASLVGWSGNSSNQAGQRKE
ncbi:MAG TPA: hypothetical protein PLD20_14970 [Blastocatellia bacterium]|nr:hypothetical protein [Blastocatellia bacterium]HMV82151.1 hypothetical protein [Blastocatellia bacterium]HMX24972.1 hypothetical protein [Blastocatellia bacterium]HMY75646.1 hypothetical protein [Blastocatellia bacterium]HMZ19235.1 hypothetical protein [Blastocatellia bacterium]